MASSRPATSSALPAGSPRSSCAAHRSAVTARSSGLAAARDPEVLTGGDSTAGRGQPASLSVRGISRYVTRVSLFLTRDPPRSGRLRLPDPEPAMTAVRDDLCRDVRRAHALLPVAVDTAGPGSGAGHERTRLRKMSASVRDAVGSWALIRIGAARRARQGRHVGSVKRVACAVGEVRLPSGRFTCICSVSPAGHASLGRAR